jgi:DNA transformation protein
VAVSPSYLDFVLEQLAGVRRVTHRRMFGGVGLYSDDIFFAVLDNETIFFKVNDDTRPRYEKRKMPAFAPIPGKPPMRGYYQVPSGVLEDADELTIWATEAVAVGAAAPPKRRKG